MLSIPFAFIGTFGGFSLLQIPLSFPAMIGIISLVGIVVNDAIVMVETMTMASGKWNESATGSRWGCCRQIAPHFNYQYRHYCGFNSLTN
ncbi:hypothetical protein RintRC_0801 [Richelia intracellularis]|nr:hypothetical protein RintRC_0801 [Richelia intracellularis]